ncbi:MAG: PilZ domain-containing protein [Nitrospira sp.]|nr:PilZ domain-containing protein [Nitrospira sp.]
MDDHRKSHRPILIASLEITLPDGGEKMDGFCLDLSSRGMRIYIPKPLSPEKCITLKMTFQATGGEEVNETLTAMVKWCKPESGMYASGIEFVDINPRENLEFLRFLTRIRAQSRS